MNALLLIGIIFALSGFKPKEEKKVGTGNETSDGDIGQITQGYYTPSNPSYGVGKMSTTASFDATTTLGHEAIMAVPVHEYFIYTGGTGWMEGKKIVGFRGAWGGFSPVEEYNPMNYTTQ